MVSSHYACSRLTTHHYIFVCASESTRNAARRSAEPTTTAGSRAPRASGAGGSARPNTSDRRVSATGRQSGWRPDVGRSERALGEPLDQTGVR